MATNTDPTPVPKVTAAGLGAAVVTLVVFILSLFGITIPAAVAAAAASVVAFVAGYLRKDLPADETDQPL